MSSETCPARSSLTSCASPPVSPCLCRPGEEAVAEESDDGHEQNQHDHDEPPSALWTNGPNSRSLLDTQSARGERPMPVKTMRYDRARVCSTGTPPTLRRPPRPRRPLNNAEVAGEDVALDFKGSPSARRLQWGWTIARASSSGSASRPNRTEMPLPGAFGPPGIANDFHISAALTVGTGRCAHWGWCS